MGVMCPLRHPAFFAFGKGRMCISKVPRGKEVFNCDGGLPTKKSIIHNFLPQQIILPDRCIRGYDGIIAGKYHRFETKKSLCGGKVDSSGKELPGLISQTRAKK